jgi:hypothetical protein
MSESHNYFGEAIEMGKHADSTFKVEDWQEEDYDSLATAAS